MGWGLKVSTRQRGDVGLIVPNGSWNVQWGRIQEIPGGGGGCLSTRAPSSPTVLGEGLMFMIQRRKHKLIVPGGTYSHAVEGEYS